MISKTESDHSAETNVSKNDVVITKTVVTAEYPPQKNELPLAGCSLELANMLKSAEEVEVKIEEVKVQSGSDIAKVTWSEDDEITVVMKDEEPEEEKSTEAIKKYQRRWYSWADVIMCAKLLTKEGGGIKSDTEQSAVIWVVLNRVDSKEYPDTIASVITQEYQFEGWDEETVPYDQCVEIAKDVLKRWNDEKNGAEDVGRTLPKEYIYFTGDGAHNYFTEVQYGEPYVWGSVLKSPYET